MSSAHNEEHIRGLLERAERAGAAGRRDESARWLAEARTAAPDHPLVLNTTGLALLNGGEAARARQFFEQAISRDGGKAPFWLNLATACRRLGQPKEEMKALTRALTLEPRYTLALLQKASLLETQGRMRQAAAVYRDALATVPRGSTLPESMRPVMEHAKAVARADDDALVAYLDEQLKDLRARHAGEPHERFDHCVEILANQRRLYRSQPTFMYFPHLPAYEYYAREHFPWLEELERATDAIRGEFERVFAEGSGSLVPYIAHPADAPLDQWRELNHSRRWSAFFLWQEGVALQAHQERCPVTTGILSRMPRPEIDAHAPTAFFSILDARTHIPPHTGVSNTRLTVHLPLVIPPGCRFRVGSDTREWRAGEAWVFDDTIEHEAWNDSDVPRAILIFDVWNPYLTAAERDLVGAATRAFGEYYRGSGDQPR